MRRIPFWKQLIYLLVTGVLLACTMGEEKRQAEQASASMLDERVQQGGMIHHRHYSEQFFKTIPQQQWEMLQNMVQIEHGDLKSYTLTKGTINTRPSAIGWSGTFAVLFYDTRYARGEGREIITLYKPDGAQAFKVLGHDFKSSLITEQLDAATRSREN